MFSRAFRYSTPRMLRVARSFSSGGNGSGSSAGALFSAVALAGVGFVYYDASQARQAMETQVSGLQVQLSGKTNSAFVFIKPHACKGHDNAVESLVEEKFKASGIRITGSGTINAEEIDKKMYIDTHYGAIASKAVKMKPYQLNVPDKGKNDFEKMFGESWDAALAAGKVYNARDGAAKLGLDSEGMNREWSKLSPGKNLIKYGGGFYCGKVGDIYVINGFYMSMRAAYCNPGEKIKYYTVQWPADSLSWGDFRGSVLGSTNPSTAPDGSIRREILKQYKALGLKSKPNTGDNGVHASASPFEALAERANWLGADIESDPFGKGMLAAGVSKELIEKWSGDAQVSVEGETTPGKKMSVFDTLEDLNADDVLAKIAKISK